MLSNVPSLLALLHLAAERIILKDLGITCFTMQHVDKYGIGRVMEMTMDQLHGRPIHCSYDIGDPLPSSFCAASTREKRSCSMLRLAIVLLHSGG